MSLLAIADMCLTAVMHVSVLLATTESFELMFHVITFLTAVVYTLQPFCSLGLLGNSLVDQEPRRFIHAKRAIAMDLIFWCGLPPSS